MTVGAGAHDATGGEVVLRVFRFDPHADDEPRYEEYAVPYSKGLTVLDGLIHAYEHVDGSLSFRWSCKNVQCGACGVLVDGQAALACEHQVEPDTMVQIDPYPLPIIKDLVVDLSVLEDRSARLFSRPSGAGRPELLSPEEVSPLVSLHKCLDCHVCDLVCPVNRGTGDIGSGSLLPSDLVQIACLVFDKREDEDRIDAAFSRRLYDCLTCGACTRECPAGIDIENEAIERLRQEFVSRDQGAYHALFDPKDWVERWVEPKGPQFLDEAEDEYRVPDATGEVGLFVGCLMNRRQQDLAWKAIELLNRAKLNVLVPKGQSCCGQPLARIGMLEDARQLLRKNTALFEDTRVATVVTACPDCSYGFQRDYSRLVGNEVPGLRFEVRDLISVMPPGVHTSSEGGKAVACHNPCYLQKQGVFLPDELVRVGVDVGEVISDCCGAGGGVYFTRGELARDIGRSAIQGHSGVVATGCPFCKEELESTADAGTKVLHYLELL